MDPSGSSSATFEIGPHRIHLSPGVMQMCFGGSITGAEAVQIKQIVFDIGERTDDLGLIVDLTGLGDFEAGAREQFARIDRRYPFYKVVFFGGSFASRVVVGTILRAGRLISRSLFSFTFDFFETEAEARRDLEAARPPEKSPAP